MKCPNCLFDILEGAAQCPFCNFTLPPPVPGGSEGAPQGEAAPAPQEGAPPVPVPGTEAVVLEGARQPTPLPHERPPEPAPPAAPAGRPSRAQGALKLAAIAAGGFIAFKLGLLDNLLAVAGLKSAPVAPAPAAAPAPPLPAPEPAPAPKADAAPAQPVPPVLPQAPAAPAPAPAPAPPTSWTFEGDIYDILSFKPVAGANLLFVTQAQDETYEAVSDGGGHWTVTLPPRKGGYKLLVDQTDYIADYFDEVAPSYKTVPLKKREQLRAATPTHAAWLSPDGKPLKRDIYLFPAITD